MRLDLPIFTDAISPDVTRGYRWARVTPSDWAASSTDRSSLSVTSFTPFENLPNAYRRMLTSAASGEYASRVISPLDEFAWLRGADGFLGSGFLPTNQPRAPEDVRLDGDVLRWRAKQAEGGSGPELRLFGELVNPTGMLDSFVRIRGAAEALRFAKRYGVLGICEHELPSSHDVPCEPRGWPDNCWEPLRTWFKYVEQARGLLVIASALHLENHQTVENWVSAFGFGPYFEFLRESQKVVWENLEEMRAVGVDAAREGLPEAAGAIEAKVEDLGRVQSDSDELAKELAGFVRIPTESREFAWFYLCRLVEVWLDNGRVRTGLSWMEQDAGPHLVLSGGTFGHLGLQLAAAVSRGQDIIVCDGCFLPYVRRNRKPQRDRRNFCEDCSRGPIPARLRQRDRQAGKAKPRKSARGLSSASS